MKTRIISGIVLSLIFIPLLIMGGITYAIFMSLISVMAMVEINRIKSKNRVLPSIPVFFSYIFVIVLTMINYNENIFDYFIDYRVIAGMLLAFISPIVFINDSKKYGFNDAIYLLGSTLFIGFGFSSLIQVRNFNLNYIIYLFLITVMTDSFAYITGMNIGKHKLAPKISPKKTIEGTVGGTLMGVIVSVLYYNYVINPNLNIVVLIGITTILSLVGQLGDLVFSFIKREYEVKDYSNLIPGHGGILDRFDSIIFVVLGFLLFLVIL